MRLHALSVSVVMPLLLVVGGVILFTPKDILSQPILSSMSVRQTSPSRSVSLSSGQPSVRLARARRLFFVSCAAR